MMDKLSAVEVALKFSEQIINHERENRTAISNDIKEKNAVLRELIEPEKRLNLNDKVANQMESYLEDAVRDRMNLKQNYNTLVKELRDNKVELTKVNH
jgi:hypothetical protein